MRVFNDFNDLKGAVGTEVGDWMEITQDCINKFAEATGDEQWIHVDTEHAARESPGAGVFEHAPPASTVLVDELDAGGFQGAADCQVISCGQSNNFLATSARRIVLAPGAHS